ncbi:DUF5017 domain-containing protein [Pedobacter hiemivivus]|uniref:DUF5017 domain-containing protein n=2 Tax=Pedobacter hiemivivus TaxID=2530454 RepID=A0A4U1GLE3_9SPHI|nr:DUF5017 domain-containing protein [Pedobacter hiemivivus]TKC65217.1 DUF5017 domain-containing protein [Pedobacter hiemivivus]
MVTTKLYKMNKLLIASVILFSLASCQKTYELAPQDDFSIELEKTSYKVGEPVKFIVNGKTENIVFWSGEAGRKYEFRKRTVVEGNAISLNFKTFAQFLTPVDQSVIKLYVSTNFSGIYDAANVRAANWEEITDKAVLSSGVDQTPSGNISLNSFAERNKNMALALVYKTTVIKPETQQNRWVIRSFDLKSTNQAGEETVLATMATAGWTAFNFSGPATNWSITSAQLLTVRNSTDLDDDWVVTKQFNPNSILPDVGEPIKNISQNLTDYTRVYTKAGVYKVSFVATNANLKESVTVVKELELTITQ